MDDLRALWFGIAFSILIASLICIVLSLLCWRWTLKPIISLFVLSATVGNYYVLSYGVVIDVNMIDNILQTDAAEFLNLIGLKLLLVIILYAVLPITALYRIQIKTLSALQQLSHNMMLFAGSCLLCVIAIAPIFPDFSSTMRNNTQLRYLISPLNSFYAMGSVALRPFKNKTNKTLAIGLDAKLGASYANQLKPPLLILVVGETARSGNFGVNGYSRDTTPAISGLSKNEDDSGQLLSFRNVWSCGTSTATSLPCMFSHLGKSAYEDKTQNYEGLLDTLQRAGLAVIWIDNQSGCKGVCDRIPNVKTNDPNSSIFCTTGDCFDEVMLQHLSDRLTSLPPSRTQNGIIIVLHQMGSHGPAYFKRSPIDLKKFQPECATNILQDCSRSEITNAYDNTILYTDKFLKSAIDFLKSKSGYADTAMVYVADHGESLGENNLYLHGLPYAIAPDVQKRVPWISWLSKDFINRNNIKSACLSQQTDKRLSHDNYFHSILGLMDIQTALYKPELDVYAPCA